MGQKLSAYAQCVFPDKKVDQELLPADVPRAEQMNRNVAVAHVVWTIVYKQTGFLSDGDLPKMAEAFWPLRRPCTDALARVAREKLEADRRHHRMFGDSHMSYLRDNEPKKYAAEMRARRRKKANRPKATRNGAAAFSRKRNQRNIFECMLPVLSKSDAPETAAWYAAKHRIYRGVPSPRWLDFMVMYGGISAQFRQVFEAALVSQS